MNQIMPVGKGILIAIDGRLTAEQRHRFREEWGERMPGIPAFVVDYAQIVREGEISLFQFTGDVSPTMVAEFQLWWEGVNRD
jgi:hypothetical protein